MRLREHGFIHPTPAGRRPDSAHYCTSTEDFFSSASVGLAIKSIVSKNKFVMQCLQVHSVSRCTHLHEERDTADDTVASAAVRVADSQRFITHKKYVQTRRDSLQLAAVTGSTTTTRFESHERCRDNSEQRSRERSAENLQKPTLVDTCWPLLQLY